MKANTKANSSSSSSSSSTLPNGTSKYLVRPEGQRGTGKAVIAKTERQACTQLYETSNLKAPTIMHVTKGKKYLVQLKPTAEVYREPTKPKSTKAKPKPNKSVSKSGTNGAKKRTRARKRSNAPGESTFKATSQRDLDRLFNVNKPA